MSVCCNTQTIACYFRNRYKGEVCGKCGRFDSGRSKPRSKPKPRGWSTQAYAPAETREALIMPKMVKRNLIVASDLSADGDIYTVVLLRESESTFFKFDLVLKDARSIHRTLGLQAASLNMDTLISLLGDDSDKWPGQKIKLIQGSWSDKQVVRIAGVSEGRRRE
jgi:hypothetical protein